MESITTHKLPVDITKGFAIVLNYSREVSEKDISIELAAKTDLVPVTLPGKEVVLNSYLNKLA